MNASQPDPKEKAKQLLAYLYSIREDRGAMADLRCALSPTRRSRAWPWLARVDGIGKPRIETVAGLFAYHPNETDKGSLGTTCRQLAAKNNSFEARFRRLLLCDRDEVYKRVRPVILAARANEIRVNYEQLYVDLWYWGERVKAAWAREYWGVEDEQAVINAMESPA